MNVETAIETLFGKIEDGSSEIESAKADALAAQFAHTATIVGEGTKKPKRTHRVVWVPTDASAAAIAVAGGGEGSSGGNGNGKHPAAAAATGRGGACVILRGSEGVPPVILGSDPGLSAELVGAETVAAGGGGGGGANGSSSSSSQAAVHAAAAAAAGGGGGGGGQDGLFAAIARLNDKAIGAIELDAQVGCYY
jgi:hypothetical protein